MKASAPSRRLLQIGFSIVGSFTAPFLLGSLESRRGQTRQILRRQQSHMLLSVHEDRRCGMHASVDCQTDLLLQAFSVSRRGSRSARTKRTTTMPSWRACASWTPPRTWRSTPRAAAAASTCAPRGLRGQSGEAQADRGDLRVAEDSGAAAQAAASRPGDRGVDLHLRGGGLQPRTNPVRVHAARQDHENSGASSAHDQRAALTVPSP